MHKVCWITTQSLGIIYWRVENFAQWLFARRKKTDVYPYVEYITNPNNRGAWESIIDKDAPESEEMRGKLEGVFNHFDSVIIQRMNYAPGVRFLDYLMKKYPDVKVYMEIDDLIGVWTPSNFYINQISDQDNVAAIQAKISHGVICSTEYLADKTKWVNDNVFVLRNCVNSKHFKLDKSIVERKRAIAYVAGGGHDEDMMIAYRGWKTIKPENRPEFIIRYGGFRPSFLEEDALIDFKMVDWHISEYPQKLKGLGVGLLIAPLRDTEFNRSKSNIKVLEASEVGIPILTSNVGPYKHVVSRFHYVTDNTPSSWSKSIQSILNTRIDIKNEFRDKIRAKYNINRECNKLIRYLIANKK